MAPQPQSDQVLVYLYLYWDAAANERKLSSIYATPERISNLGGEPVLTTAREVPAADVLNSGLYTPQRPRI